MSNSANLIRTAAALSAIGSQATIIAKIAGANPTPITKVTVGLPNVDNTTDASKPVSTFQETRIVQALNDANAHSDANDIATLASAVAYTDTEIAALTGLVGDGGAATLAAAKTYADGKVLDAQTAAAVDATTKSDAAQSTAISTAASDATTKSAAALVDAKAYADTSAGALSTALQNYATAADAATLALANTHSDNAALTAQGAAESFASAAVAAGDAATLVTAEAYVDAAVVAVLASAQSYADSKTAGLLDARGTFNPVTEGTEYPTSTSGLGGSGASGSVAKSDFWFIGEDATINGKPYTVGDIIFALNDAPGQTDANWDGLNTPLTYVPESIANKATAIDITNSASDVKYPTVKAVVDYTGSSFTSLDAGTAILSVQEQQQEIIMILLAQVSALQDAIATP